MKRKTILKMIKNLVFFIVLIILTFWLIFKDQDMNELLNVIKLAKKEYIFLGIVLMLIYYSMEAYNIRSTLQSFGDKKISMLKALKFTWIGFFFSSITPAASGGQPAEIYYMTKEKISGARSTMSLLLQLCGFQIVTISLGAICAICNPSILEGGLTWLFLLGITLNSTALILLFICIFSKKLTNKLLIGIEKILRFFKFKNIEERIEKIENGIERYDASSIYIKTHKREFIKIVLRVFVQVTCYYSVPFCVYRAFGLNTYSLIQIFSMQAVLYTTISGLPLPGAIGATETVFLKIFGPAFGKELLSGGMLLSRGITFYLFVIISLICVIVNAIKMKDVKIENEEQIKSNAN